MKGHRQRHEKCQDQRHREMRHRRRIGDSVEDVQRARFSAVGSAASWTALLTTSAQRTPPILALMFEVSRLAGCALLVSTNGLATFPVAERLLRTALTKR